VDAIPPLLAELVLAPGPSGSEDLVQAIVRREAAAIGADVETDVLGSTVARLRGSAGGRVLALVAHADQVGLVVRAVGEDGLLRVAAMGSWPSSAANGQRMRVLTRGGEIRGVVVAPREGEATWDTVRLDVGAAGRDDALALVRQGDVAVPHGPPEPLPNGRILSAALDNRLGIFAGIEVLRRLAAEPPAWDVALAVTAQEETGHGGARAVADRLRPDVALVLEVTYAADAPGMPPWGDARLGSGPSVFRGAVVSPVVGDALLATAEEEVIPVALEAGGTTWSDADDMFDAAGGVACGVVSIPLRYMHTAGEVAQLSDVEATIRLVTAYARSLGPHTSLLR
jgi:endoglucanase